jgi:hypothetical protein
MSNAGRWKYLVVTVKIGWTGSIPDERVQSELTEQGNLGWELVSAVAHSTGIKLLFKKPG